MAVLFVCALLLLSTQGILAFKEHDFKKCATANFCHRNRGRSGTKYIVDPYSIKIESNYLQASLSNVDSNSSFLLSLGLFGKAGATIRLKIDEDPPVGRYQVPDVVLPNFAFTQQEWSTSDASKEAVTLKTGSAQVLLEFSPMRIKITSDGKPALDFNSRDMFNFEQRRVRQDGDPDGWWQESFNSNTDSKPKGPEAISLDLVFPGFDYVYGIPEHATSFALKQTTGVSEPYRMYNLDVFEYLDNSPFGLYGSIPFMVAHKVGFSTGVLWLNAAEMYIDVEKKSSGMATQWISEAGIVDLYVFLGPTPAAVQHQYAEATGPTALPQLFSLGYHQCRWNYKDEADVFQVDSGFDSYVIPYDVLWLDIEHTNGKRYMTWASNLFPHPVEMQENLASRGRKMVTIIDPHVKRDGSYPTHQEAERLGHYVKNKDGQDFDGWCWPGSSSYLDVTSPVVRDWWSQQFMLDKYVGSTKFLYIWNDMNEPSVFNGPEITMPKDNLHYGGTEHRDVHNLYGYFYHMATAEGLVKRGYAALGPDGDRPFVLSRAFFAGTQRVGPIWTGDNFAQWSHLKVSVPMLLSLSVAGLPNVGADVGGFFGNPDVELLTRWYQLGTFYPFFRGHAHLETQRREPWLFGDEATNRIRDAIRERYALLPYMYTLFRQANVTGDPVMRPLWYEFPNNKDTFAVEEEFMLGPAILVRPVLTQGASSVDALLPRGARWYEAGSGAEMKKSTWLPGLDQVYRLPLTMNTIPFFYRGGSIIPRKERPRRSTAVAHADPYTLIVALDDKMTASGDLYLDDGSSFAFMRGGFVHRDFVFESLRLKNKRHADANTISSKMQSGVLIERIVFLGLPGKSWKARFTNQGVEVVQDLQQGPMTLKYPNNKNAFVLRKPSLPISMDWTLELLDK